jgi:hypothetical protein
MNAFVVSDTLEARLRSAVSVAWQAFSRKVGGGLIPVNREASMQLQFAYVLKQLLPLAVQRVDESAELELEACVETPSGPSNVDVILRGNSPSGAVNIAIEMKCYRTIAASGGTRGAHDIFMKDVYEDLHVLEEYVACDVATHGVALVMNDLQRFVAPKVKRGKCWAYDISNGHTFPGGNLRVDVGGKRVRINLQKSYTFRWSRFGNFWFMELEGVQPQLAHALNAAGSDVVGVVGIGTASARG